jgi:hypothetical protein
MRASTTLQPQPADESGFQPTLLFGLSVLLTPASCPAPLLLFPAPLLLPPVLLLLGTPPDEEPLVLDPLDVLEPELLLVLDPLLELVLLPLLDPELLPLLVLLPLLDPELLLLELPDPWSSAPFGVPQPVGPS